MGVRFKGWGIAVPDRVVTNDELSQTLDTSDEWITERTGIRERRDRRLGDDPRGHRRPARHGRRRGECGGHRLPRLRHDHPGPALSRRPHRWSPTSSDSPVPAMDVNAACSGFMYAVRTAYGLLETGNKRILVIGAENLSRWVDWNDRNMAVLLGRRRGRGGPGVRPRRATTCSRSAWAPTVRPLTC